MVHVEVLYHDGEEALGVGPDLLRALTEYVAISRASS